MIHMEQQERLFEEQRIIPASEVVFLFHLMKFACCLFLLQTNI